MKPAGRPGFLLLCTSASPAHQWPNTWRGHQVFKIMKCLVFAFAFFPNLLQVIYRRDIYSSAQCQCLASWLNHPPHVTAPWAPFSRALWCFMVCCMEQGLLLALSVLQRIEGMAGGRESWGTTHPSSLRKQEYFQLKWNAESLYEWKYNSGLTRTEHLNAVKKHQMGKIVKEKRETPIVFPEEKKKSW